MATILPSAWYWRMRASLASGVASARKSSTPASAAMAAAVSGLSPVTMMVLMPMARSSAKRSRMPPLTMSLSQTTPSARPFSATTRGVPPDLATSWMARSTSAGRRWPEASARALTASEAPLRMVRPGRSTPDRRVWAVKATKVAPMALRSRPRRPKRSLARTTMERPSGVSSAREASWAASARALSSTPLAGRKAEAWRLPRVMVPVLSRSSTSTSPAASTARPEVAMTPAWMRRSMPAMPMAESRPPMVVGARQTKSAVRAVMVTAWPWPAAATA